MATDLLQTYLLLSPQILLQALSRSVLTTPFLSCCFFSEFQRSSANYGWDKKRRGHKSELFASVEQVSSVDSARTVICELKLLLRVCFNDVRILGALPSVDSRIPFS